MPVVIVAVVTAYVAVTWLDPPAPAAAPGPRRRPRPPLRRPRRRPTSSEAGWQLAAWPPGDGICRELGPPARTPRTGRRRARSRRAATARPSTDDGVGDGQAEARAAALLGRTVEPVEEPVPVAAAHPWSAVLDRHGHAIAPLTNAHPDDAARARVPARVVDQDPGEAVDPLRRSADPGRARAAGHHLDVEVLRRGQRAEPVGAGGGDGGEVQRLVDWARAVPSRTGRARAGPRRSCAACRSRPRCATARRGTPPGLRGALSARLVSALITLSGVRSSCEASAVNSSCRLRDCSTGSSARMPMVSAPPNMASSRIGAANVSPSRSSVVRWSFARQALAGDEPHAVHVGRDRIGMARAPAAR